MKIVYITGMDNLPETCGDCSMSSCALPLKQYKTKRHKDCPLRKAFDTYDGLSSLWADTKTGMIDSYDKAWAAYEK